MRRIITRGTLSGRFPVGLNSIMKVGLALVLFAVSAAANAVQVLLLTHNQTSGSGAISTLITDGSHIQGQPASTAIFDWDGTTLTSTGLYSAVGSLGSSIYAPTILNDQIVDLSINTASATGSATSYACIEGTFLASVGANGCGGYTLGVNFSDDSTTVWAGLTVSQTIGGDDVVTGSPRLISAYDFGSLSFTGTGLAPGDLVKIGNGQPLGEAGLDGELMTFQVVQSVVDDTANARPSETINIDVLGNDALVGNITALTVTTPANGTVVVNGVPGPQSGVSLDYTADAAFIGDATFDYTATDTGDMIFTPVTKTAGVTVTIVDGPVAKDDGSTGVPFAKILAGTTLSLNVLANDSGLNDTPLSVAAPFMQMPALGTATVTGSPGDSSKIRIDYAAGANPGPDSFDYQITDNSGKLSAATVFVEVTVPVVLEAVDDAFSLFAVPKFAGGADDFEFSDVLKNDTGLDNSPLTLTITSDPTNGIIGSVQGCAAEGANCQVSYRPNEGFVGTDSYQYMLTDSVPDNSNIATVTLTVQEVPIANDVSASALESVATDPINVLANDTGLVFPPLTVTISNPAQKGTAVAQADNTIIYTSAGGTAKTDVFEYTVTDANGNSSSAKVNVAITPKQGGLPGNSNSATGPVGLVLLLLLPWLRRRRD